VKVETAEAEAPVKHKPAATTNEKIWREVVSWFWVIVAFLLIEGTMVQARVIPSGSMENTVLVGDHLIVSRFGFDAGIPFTDWHVPLWRNPKRQQIIVFRAPLPEEGNPTSSSAASACRATM
jgi:signal peptidase I